MCRIFFLCTVAPIFQFPLYEWLVSASILHWHIWREPAQRGQENHHRFEEKKRNAVIFGMIMIIIVFFSSPTSRPRCWIFSREKNHAAWWGTVKAWCLSENGWTTPSCWCCGIHLLMERLLFGHPYRIIFAKVRHIHIQLWCCCGQIY